MSGYLSPQQVDTLLRGIKPSRVLHLDGMSHLAAYDVRAHLNRVFGFGRWSADVLDVTPLYEQETETKNKKPAYKVGYRATVRLSVCSPDGTPLATYTECAVGESVMPDFKRGDCHDMAVKTAESQALKRCATNLGDQFGLSLYRNGSPDPVVTVTLVGHVEPDGEGGPDASHEVPDVLPEQEPGHEVATPTVDTDGPTRDYGTPRTPPPPTYAELLLDVQQATSTDALNAAGHRANSAQGHGHITAEELDTLRDLALARRLELTTPQSGESA